jgi:hypothetical protein
MLCAAQVSAARAGGDADVAAAVAHPAAVLAASAAVIRGREALALWRASEKMRMGVPFLAVT